MNRAPLLLLLLAFVAPAARAESVPSSTTPRIRSLVFAGRARTHEDVVRRELGLAPGDAYDRGRLDAGVQRLKNLQIFSDAEARVTGSDEVDIELTLHERWTLLPDVRFTRGGGTSYFALGLLDINAFGRALQLGGRAELFGGVPGAELWVTDPRLFTGPFATRIEASSTALVTRRVQPLYHRGGGLEGAFLLEERRLELELLAVHRELYSVGVDLAFADNDYSGEQLDDEERAANTTSGLAPTGGARQLLLGLPLRLGRIDYDRVTNSGATLDLLCERAFTLSSSGAFASEDGGFNRCTTELIGFVTTPFGGNLGARVGFGATSATALPHLFLLGGFDRLRGFADGQLRGRQTFYANLEARIASVDSYHFVLQHVAFLDAGDAASGFHDLAFTAPPASAGIGVRFILPQIFGAIIRVDYGWGLGAHDAGGLSLALGQFF